jgi:inosine/xanthosine triphosphate pyrophosphatase family protein
MFSRFVGGELGSNGNGFSPLFNTGSRRSGHRKRQMKAMSKGRFSGRSSRYGL